MYEYSYVVELLPQQILQKVSQEQIFEWILNRPFGFDKKYDSPIREHSKGEGSGKCRFERRPDSTILFIDFGDTQQTHRTCFGLLMAKENIPLNVALQRIIDHFKIPNDINKYEPIINQTDYTTVVTPRAEITYTKAIIQPYNVSYWRSYFIEPKDLSEDNTQIVESFTTYKNGKLKTFQPYKHCYAFDFYNHVKIYQPFQTDYKFISNCDEDDIGNVNGISESGDKLIWKKSYKDHRVVRNIGGFKDVIWLQNEGCIPSEYILINLLDRFDIMTLFYDNDQTGLKAMYKLYKKMKFIRPYKKVEIKFIPHKFGYKDPSDFAHAEGRADTIKLFKHIKL